ncbi:MAG: Asp-tRNA(Asn)/Glu-tRNA(Gln) amidotransferase subunit GatC [Candidatus Magasanikbacteria bacterium]|jgi:aspartyl-tRNA(Asn)/glutamyl-tRNA(Gln) amidotransferase subunit C|nr:Asp-tRNA(Asn)/Glu-tRNA(Gln) amidotransferase subunit GatC [Candidatus Magasanikbacteria bacterium]MBT4314890.1 Asp-tRNA(Asn)/Glu-tRNA(Gln) amidotransferase subunit GatC [Candidatus Magasanikbacteria bacterium]MBT4546846.1 Asp-tRNA(Asn)/Glu-tRNA(Gln) amidotransferase subunit GatC [Candidatus Magasanikbacteria bacterium]MBT6819281.1 Asp-tRNA(Asn)/Glu-tRNA(Gln) amidotransferase subunit GatC [Candidatus Magasanikbacteria bacterium]
MKLTPQEVEDIAKLARLELSVKEKKMYAEQLSVVLDYVEILNEVDTDGVEETCQVTGLEDVVREDKIIECDEETKKKIIDQFPEKMGKLLKVKAIFADEK